MCLLEQPHPRRVPCGVPCSSYFVASCGQQARPRPPWSPVSKMCSGYRRSPGLCWKDASGDPLSTASSVLGWGWTVRSGGGLRVQAQHMNPGTGLLRPTKSGRLQPLEVRERSLQMMEQVLGGTRGPSFQRVLKGSAGRSGLGGKPTFLCQQPLSPVAQAPKQT